MSKFKNFKSIKEVVHNGSKYTVLVYGEVCEVNEVPGFYAVPVVFNGKTNKPIAIDYEKRFVTPGYKQYYARTKVFNMGWAICAECDSFDLDTGIKICRRRFNRSPITTQNGRFLTPDMCSAIVANETEYIANHIEMFLPKNKNNSTPFENVKNEPTTFKVAFDCDFKKNDDNHHDEALEVGLNEPYNDGDFVYFESNNKPYVGIFQNEVYDEKTSEWLRDNYYFLAPIDDNGLISHNEAKFYSSIDDYDGMDEADEDDIKLINDYLKGAHSKAWDKNSKKFKIIF